MIVRRDQFDCFSVLHCKLVSAQNHFPLEYVLHICTPSIATMELGEVVCFCHCDFFSDNISTNCLSAAESNKKNKVLLLVHILAILTHNILSS